MIANLVSVHVKPEFVEQFKEITTYNHNNTRKEPGNVRFDVLWNKDDPTRFTLYEVFADADAVVVPIGGGGLISGVAFAIIRSTSAATKPLTMVVQLVASPPALPSLKVTAPPKASLSASFG